VSKIFEALQRLERESGKLPPGVLPEAHRVFQSGTPDSDSAAAVEDTNGTSSSPNEAPTVTSFRATSETVEPAFDLRNVPVENVALTPESRLVYYSQPDSPGADRFRLLRMGLWPFWESGKLKTLLVTSALAQDGKSTVVLNLATALAEQGQRTVLVIEGDLCHPSLSPRLAIPDRAGLAECIEGAQNPLSLLRRLDPLGWYVLPAGHAEGNPTELLQAPIVPSIFETLRPYFDWIIIDTPPAMPLTDTLSLRQYADAGLLVVRAERTPRDAVEAAIGRIGPQNLLGIVLNGSEELDRLYSDYRKSYTPEPKRTTTS
jgi:capsular exopolysaccharide synthesis family protein